jgi:hypothetical protein
MADLVAGPAPRGILAVCGPGAAGIPAAAGNGEPYYPFQGRTIHVPQREVEQPARDLLAWHADTVFRG